VNEQAKLLPFGVSLRTSAPYCRLVSWPLISTASAMSQPSSIENRASCPNEPVLSALA